MQAKNTYIKITHEVTPAQIWAIWSNIDRRHEWDKDTEWAKLEGEFKAGNIFYFKPKGGPKLKMLILECTPNKSFTDRFKMPGAILDGIHELEATGEGLKITTSMKVSGPLSWLWQKLLVNKIVALIPEQTELLIQAAKKV